MKKVFLTIATAALFSVNVFAIDGGKKTEEPAKVSYSVQRSFSSDFANAKNVVWTVTTDCQKAEFTVEGVKKTAFYNKEGEFLGTTQSVNYNAIPQKSQTLIAVSYPGYIPKDVIVYQTNQELNTTIDPTSYFVDLKSSDHEVLVRVTDNGKLDFFKQVK